MVLEQSMFWKAKDGVYAPGRDLGCRARIKFESEKVMAQFSSVFGGE